LEAKPCLPLLKRWSRELCRSRRVECHGLGNAAILGSNDATLNIDELIPLKLVGHIDDFDGGSFWRIA
jgi:hypothetical protein